MEPEPVHTGVQEWLWGIGVGAMVIALLIAAYIAGYDHGKRAASPRQAAQPTTTQPTSPAATGPAATGPGRALFAGTCGGCHTLASAGTHGQVGPNLDQLKPDAARVLAAIQNGGTGSGVMPKGLFSGTQAKQVADFVSQTAGR